MRRKNEAAAPVPAEPAAKSALAVVDEHAACESAADAEGMAAAWAMYREILEREIDREYRPEDGPTLVEIMKDLGIDRRQVEKDLATLTVVREHLVAAADPKVKREAAAAARTRWKRFLKENEELCRTTRREVDAVVAADEQAFYARERLKVLKREHPELLAAVDIPE
ncbi:MAG: hypothetical protein KA184_11775 [Candidatus Hydrogenedentes bacterium]|nr:hypothetical protein [Candidatus Hydrogenedentota bacterium]